MRCRLARGWFARGCAALVFEADCRLQTSNRTIMNDPTENPSLDQIEPGASVVLKAFRGDRELRGRLMLLGLSVGAVADVVQRRNRGPTLLRVRNTLVAIGYEEAKTILVDVSR